MAEEPTRLGDRLEAMDREVKMWAALTRKALLFRLASMGLQERASLEGPGLYKSLKSNLRKKDGDIEKVSFAFARHGIFIEQGVGKGRPRGSSSANQAKQPWLVPELPDAVEKLADLLQEEYADIAAAEVRILIPGIITKISG